MDELTDAEHAALVAALHTLQRDLTTQLADTTGRTGTVSADRMADFVRQEGLGVKWLLDTHVHADHLTATAYLKEKLGGVSAIGDGVTRIQETFADAFNLGGDFPRDGRQFDRLLAEGERLPLGEQEIECWHVPGHTPACAAYLVADAVFVGDTMFMPDYGSARCDFPGGDARTLFRSVRRILSLPPETRLFMCHDYKAPGRDEYKWETTVAEQRRRNPHLRDGISEEDFVAIREARDSELSLPVLILPSVQVNMRAGHFPEPEDNGVSYLKIPLDTL